MSEFDYHKNALDVFARQGDKIFSDVTPEAYLAFLMTEGKNVSAVLALARGDEEERIPGEGRLFSPEPAMRFATPPNLVFELAGPPGGGKSLFMNRLYALLGGQCYWVKDKAREAKQQAMAQSIAEGLGDPEDVAFLTEYYKDRGEDELFELLEAMNSGRIARKPIVTERSIFDFNIMRAAKALVGDYLPLDIDLKTNFFELIWKNTLRAEKNLRGQERPTLLTSFMLLVPPSVSLERKPHRGSTISPEFLPILYGEYLIAHLSRLLFDEGPTYYLALNTNLRTPADTTTRLLEAMGDIKAANFFPEYDV